MVGNNNRGIGCGRQRGQLSGNIACRPRISVQIQSGKRGQRVKHHQRQVRNGFKLRFDAFKFFGQAEFVVAAAFSGNCKRSARIRQRNDMEFGRINPSNQSSRHQLVNPAVNFVGSVLSGKDDRAAGSRYRVTEGFKAHSCLILTDFERQIQ